MDQTEQLSRRQKLRDDRIRSHFVSTSVLRSRPQLTVDVNRDVISNGARYTVQTSEKASGSFRLEVTNPGGHSSQPKKDNAIYRFGGGVGAARPVSNSHQPE